MQLNGTAVVDRHNRPTVIQKVALRAFFINDGEYYDPVDISGVTVFQKASNFSPSSVLNGNVIASSVPSSIIVMQFGASANDSGAALDPTSYNPTDPSSLSGIYRVKTGEYICVLDGTQEQQGNYDFYGSAVSPVQNLIITNSASSVTDYIDCWTVSAAVGSNLQTLINDFHLYDDTFFSITQPLLLATRNKLLNKHMTLSSIENLKVTTEITIQNKDIDQSVKNIFKDSAITSAMMQIEKVNEDSTTLPATVVVSGFSDTSSIMDITSDNTMSFSFDTTKLATHPRVADFGGLTGTYRAVVKYTLLNETIISPPYYFTVS
jgi:hypothetical protein